MAAVRVTLRAASHVFHRSTRTRSTRRYTLRRQLCLLREVLHHTMLGVTELKLKQTWVPLNVTNEQRKQNFLKQKQEDRERQLQFF